ncbi:MAG: EscN/YscN/HrcN family type III secretion system ATPase [Proteobacteria bacterium SG_bin7]|nr:MAG: EscN/YscN/HrcN family type III secretion system ATPase [Proteobacteria bacterium SG_bin7]
MDRLLNLDLDFEKYDRVLDFTRVTKDVGKVTHVTGFLLQGYLPGASLGSLVEVYPSTKGKPFLAEVVGFRDRSILFMPLGEMRGVGLGSKIILVRQMASVGVGDELLGRVIDALGNPVDNKGPISLSGENPLYRDSANPMDRPPIDTPIDLGIRAINGFTTVGQGQRVGIMAGSGVGKSVLLGMVARSTNADVNVIALIGERGREVREFLEKDLGAEGLSRSVVIVATSDQSPLLRMRGAFVASAIAEYFSTQGKNVLLMMDSVTRFAMAQREVGLSTGEPPATKGYTPSVFSLLPKLLERAGNFERGSITGIFTVLVEGDEMDDPIADSVRSIVDGHIVLDRGLAHKGHFPAVDVLQSTSRVMRSIVPSEVIKISRELREMMAVYRDAEDLIRIGAYKQGANKTIDRAIALEPVIKSFLMQEIEDKSNLQDTFRFMEEISHQG